MPERDAPDMDGIDVGLDVPAPRGSPAPHPPAMRQRTRRARPMLYRVGEDTDGLCHLRSGCIRRDTRQSVQGQRHG